MKACPKCGANDWKSITEQRQYMYKACGNCKFAPALAKAKTVDAKEWVLGIAKEHQELQEEAFKVEQKFHDHPSPTTLQHGLLNRAHRLLAASDLKMHIAEAISEVVDATESGQITMLIPELGLFQFEWGNFDLFKAIDKVDRE